MNEDEERERLLRELAQARAELADLSHHGRPWLHLDLTMGQMKTLVVLQREQHMVVSDVADSLGISRPAASLLIDRLVQLELVGRHEDREDRRRTLVALTPQGRELVDRLLNGPSTVRDSMARLPLADLAALARGTRALVDQVRKDLPAPADERRPEEHPQALASGAVASEDQR